MTKYSPAEAFRSNAHRHIEDILYEMGINFDSEIPFHPYRVDIYITEWHLAVEVDGPLHSRKKDDVRDNTLDIAYHLPVLHISTKLHLKKQEVKDELTAFFEKWADSAEDRKDHARQPSS